MKYFKNWARCSGDTELTGILCVHLCTPAVNLSLMAQTKFRPISKSIPKHK